MHARLALAILALQCCEICVTIRVPTVWDGDDSEVQPNEEFSVEEFKPVNVQQKQIPVKYFEYTAKKPQFAVDVAAYHGVRSPEKHYKAYPVRPYTGKLKPELGVHRLQDENRPVFHDFQNYLHVNKPFQSNAAPVSANYEIFHPYKAEEPGLQSLYKDPILEKIRNDIRDSSQRLQHYETEAGKPNITKDEYLESLEQTDFKKAPQKNVPAPYEIHRPQRRPIYYRPVPKPLNRDHILNQRFQHPWHQNFYKIRPIHYRPLKQRLQRLRQHHALTYGDELNEYPQAPVKQAYEEPSEGYDIYERGKDKYLRLRNNLDESVNNLLKENRPSTSAKLELQNDDASEEEEEQEFVPVKNYAQVRKTETTKHLPKEAAFDEAESFEEIKNAPRLKEAIKSTKAQTVYTEEGYEDSAYDHAGEQKHASDHEAHAGFLKEKELSGGKYKTPSLSQKYEDAAGSAYQDQTLHGEKWSDDNKDKFKETELEEYDENEQNYSVKGNDYTDSPIDNEENQRNKRQDVNVNGNISEEINEQNTSEYLTLRDEVNDKNASLQHDVNKREALKVPDIDINSTLLTEKDILQIANEKPTVKENLTEKYPYYFKDLRNVHRDSPLKYAENFKLIPKKSYGGSEFYESRSHLECPEVDEKLAVLPEKFKKKGHPDAPDDNTKNGSEENVSNEQGSRLQGLGDKIDCFKAKYFGMNPLDNPFFDEDIIKSPEPLRLPDISVFKLKSSKLKSADPETAADTSTTQELDVANLFADLEKKQQSLRDSLLEDYQKTKDKLNHSVLVNVSTPQGITPNPSFIQKEENIVSNKDPEDSNIATVISNDEKNKTLITENVRKRRSTSFVYEPYKIIKDVQVLDSKKTTTSSNISPLIKQLQSSKVIDAVEKLKTDKEQPVKRNVRVKYKDIGKQDRSVANSDDQQNTEFVNVNVDKRRGEPRYEMRPLNHKTQYAPVKNRKSMSVEDYEAHTKSSESGENKDVRHKHKPIPHSILSSAIENSKDIQSVAASNNVRSTITTTSAPENKKNEEQDDENNSEEYDDEYEDEDSEEVQGESEIKQSSSTTTTTTTTPKPSFRKRLRSTTIAPETITEREEERPIIHLTTRFRHSPPKKKTRDNPDLEENAPAPAKYREKKKKSSKSTLVTDTKQYGDGEDDMRKEEIDAMIGVKHDMDEYTPQYEKEQEGPDYESSEEEYDEDDEDEEEDDESEEDETEDQPVEQTTTESLNKTSKGISTNVEKNAKLESKPIVLKKRLEIHKDLPENKSLPHTTKFKEDIEEVEIIREIPNKRLSVNKNKNLELLDLYKDDNLASDINKLGAVEIFKENLDLKRGPKHGGNYRRAPDTMSANVDRSAPNKNNDLKDAEASQSENQKLIELDDDSSEHAMHGGNLKSLSDMKSGSKSAKIIELVENKRSSHSLHGGNLRSLSDRNNRRGSKKSERIIELDSDHEDGDSSDSNLDNKPGRSLHGGNYKNSQNVENDSAGDESTKELEIVKNHAAKDPRKHSADLLNSFVQAVPILTTTPSYILDPSKRMYYYVD